MRSDDLALALAIADAADQVTMARYLASDLVVATKPDTTPVTEADQQSERTIRELLAEHRPADGILGEEFGEHGSGGRRWIVDPIDGTMNYLRGVPVWATLLALEEDGELVLGVVSAPALGRRWWAARGAGAHTRDVDGSRRRISASAVTSLADASFSYSDERGWDARGARPGLRDLVERCWRVRAYGDFWSHMLVAEGAVDIAAEPALAPWDVAALVPIVTEAGGTMTSFDGSPCLVGHSGLTTNGALHPEVVALLAARGQNR